MVPPPGDRTTAVCGDKGHHFHVAECQPALNRLGIRRIVEHAACRVNVGP